MKIWRKRSLDASVSPLAPRRHGWGPFLLTTAFVSCLAAYVSVTLGPTVFNSTQYPTVSKQMPYGMGDLTPYDGPTSSSAALSTSAWCRGSSITDRRCRFKNLCYSRSQDEFLFVHGPSSSSVGLDDRGAPVASLTSVQGLNVHYLHLTDLPAAALDMSKVHFWKGTTLLLKRFKPDNLMHVLHDDVLPLYATLRELCFGEEDPCFGSFRIALLDGHPSGPFLSYYALLSGNVLLASDLDLDIIHCFERSYAGINRETLWYDYGFDRPQSPIPGPPAGETVRSFSRFVLSRLGIRQQECGLQPYAVLVSRSRDRLVLNEPEVEEAVARATDMSVVRLEDRDRLDPRKALGQVACAEMLVGMHGAELVLALFLKPGSVLLEMFPYAVPAREYAPYRTLAGIPDLGLAYGAWENGIPGNSRGRDDRLRDLSPEETRRILASARVSPRPCCEDPEWLYRIYQDTEVDVPSFSRVLGEALRSRAARTAAPEEDLYPGPVRNAVCTAEGKGYALSWVEPWNLRFLAGGDSALYEVWIRAVGEEESRAVVTPHTSHFVPGERGDGLDCWIGCRTRNKTGIRRWVRCG